MLGATAAALGALWLAPASFAQLAPEEAADPAAPAVPGEAVVRFEPGTTAAERLDARDAAGATFERSLGVPRAQLVELSGDVAAAVERLERQADVAYAQPNYRYRTLAAAPNDTFFGSLWGFSDPAPPNPGVNVLSAWDTTRGAGQAIAVVDTGVDLTHPDLAGNLVPGFDFVDGDADPDDYDFHGTHVAGTIAALAGNATGVAGIAPEAKIMPVRVLDGDGSGSTSDIADGIAFAALSGATVINLSLGGPAGAGDQVMSDAIALADARDVVVVAAAGNDGTDNDAAPVSPCTIAQPNLLCVAAVTQGGGLASFSNYGAATVDLGAPGSGILSARTDYGAIEPMEDFSDGLAGWTSTTFSGIPWGQSAVGATAPPSAADSPGAGQPYAADSDTQLIRSTPANLAGRRGCRMHFALRYEIESPGPGGQLFDYLMAGAISGGPVSQDTLEFAGSSGGAFVGAEVSISNLDGRTDVKPAFALFSDETEQFDGAYVDDLRLLCRDGTYVNSAEPTGNYVSFSGTSMAAPHVAGVAALVGAADPAAPDTEVAQAILASAVPLPALAGRTVTGGIADARGAIDVALGLPAPPPPGPISPPPPVPPPAPAATPPPAPAATPPPRAVTASLRGHRLVVGRDGRLRLRIRARVGLVGRVTLTTAARLRGGRGGRGRRVRVLVRAFRGARRGTVTIRPRLARGVLALVRRHAPLAVRVKIVVRDAAAPAAAATVRARGRLVVRRR